MKEIALALITGVVLGAVFRLMNLPLPAPTAFAGLVGIFGIWLGSVIVQWLWK